MNEPRDGVRRGDAENELINITLNKISLKQSITLTAYKGVTLSGSPKGWYILRGRRKTVRAALSAAKVKGHIV